MPLLSIQPIYKSLFSNTKLTAICELYIVYSNMQLFKQTSISYSLLPYTHTHPTPPPLHTHTPPVSISIFTVTAPMAIYFDPLLT